MSTECGGKMKNVLLVLALYYSFLHLIYSVPVDTKKCKKANGNFPMPGSSCKSYYSCKNWKPMRGRCPSGEHFFPEKGYCVDAHLYPCFEEPKSKECPLPNGNFLKPNTTCVGYYDCCNGVPTEKRCISGLLFDQDKGVCDWAELVTCPEEPKSKECPQPNGTFLKPATGCKIYYVCKNGIATEMKCPDDQLFDPDKQTCEWSDIYTCIENQCLPNPCQNNGTCSLKYGNVICSCQDPFIGRKCEINQCSPNPCHNNGTCSVKYGKVICSCDGPFTGEKCEINQCIPNPCLNDGICNAKYGKIRCICKDPFTGENCEKNKCDPNPCHNNGTCLVIYGNVACYCKDPFTGRKCEKNQCDPNPCLNEGTCDVKSGKMTCSCKDPFTGEKCEKNLCQPNPCHNDGICNAKYGEISCFCKEPFAGNYCEKNPCLPNPCLNDGVCSISNNNTICLCKYPFTGQICEKEIKTESTTPETITEPITEADIICPDTDGYYPHPTNKHKFISCVGGDLTVMDCYGNLVYDQEKKSCEYDIE